MGTIKKNLAKYRGKGLKGLLRKKPRWLLWLLLIFIVYAIITAFLAIKKCDTLVQIELTVSKVSFDLLEIRGDQPFSSLPVKTVRFADFEEFTLPFAEAEIACQFDKNDFSPSGWAKAGVNGMLRVSPKDRYANIIFLREIWLNKLNLPQGARVTLNAPNNKGQKVKLTVDKVAFDGKINIGDTLVLECQNCKIGGLAGQCESAVQHFRIFNSRDSETVNFRSGKDGIIMSMELQPEDSVLGRNIRAKNLSFVEGRGTFQRSSLTKPGKIILNDLADKEIAVQSFAFVQIDTSSILEIMEITFQHDGIALVLFGKVNELKTGTKEFLSNQLPSCLIWIRYHPVIRWLVLLLAIVPIMLSILQLLDLFKSNHSPKKPE